MTESQPTLARRTLGSALQRLREAKGITRQEAGEAIGYSRVTLMRIETGVQGAKLPVVKELCELYEAPDQQRSELCRLSVDSNKRGFWEGYKDGIEPRWRVFAETEQDATWIREWEPEFIPGLLQTPEYLRALQAVHLDSDEVSSKTAQEFRAGRQESIWPRKVLPKIQFVMGESALRYLDGLGEVKDAQFDRILEAAGRRNVDIRVVTRLHAAMVGAFTILVPKGEGRPFVYIDALDGCRYVEDPDVVSRFDKTFKAVLRAAIPIKEYLA